MFKKFTLFILLALLINAGCNTQNKKHKLKSPSSAAYTQSFEKIYYSLPSPMELADLLSGMNLEISSSYFNPLDNLNNYESDYAQAINLGIYGTDLSFAIIFNQKNFIESYYNAVYNLAQKLDILNAVGDSLLNLVQQNIDQPKTLEPLISEVFFRTNAYLENENRQNISSLIIFGGWLETMYIALSLTKSVDFDSTNNNALFMLIADQQLVLQNLRSMVNMVNLGSKEQILNDIEKVLQDLDKMRQVDTVTVYDKIANRTIKATKIKYVFTHKGINNLYSLVSNIRMKYINLP